jgi:hypothetical protein
VSLSVPNPSSPGSQPTGPHARHRRTDPVRTTARRCHPRRLVAGLHALTLTQRGQGTVEYALVLLGAAAVALALVAWVARSGAVGQLFDSVVGRVLRSAG